MLTVTSPRTVPISPIHSSARTLAQVAIAAGVSKMTVSRVLRHPELVSERTRERVLACVDQLNYRPNPLISTLMASTRQRRASATDAGIAYLFSQPRQLLDRYEVAAAMFQGAQARALSKGYELTPHSLSDERIPIRKLSKVFKARGIEGVIFAHLEEKHANLEIDLEQLVGVTCGYRLVTPALHRVATNQRELAKQAYLKALERGYQRIGVALSQGDPLGLQWISAISEVQAQPLVLAHPSKDRAAFLRWLKQEQPDCVIGSTLSHHQWLCEHGLRIPKDIGFLMLGYFRDHSDFAGFSKNYEGIGAAAVDLISLQLHDNERGIPSCRKTVLLDPKWNEGCTLRPPPPWEC